MQDGHNDYLLLTRGYLKDYKRLMDMRKGWIAEMGDAVPQGRPRVAKSKAEW